MKICSRLALRSPLSILLSIGVSMSSWLASCLCSNPLCSLRCLICSPSWLTLHILACQILPIIHKIAVNIKSDIEKNSNSQPLRRLELANPRSTKITICCFTDNYNYSNKSSTWISWNPSGIVCVVVRSIFALSPPSMLATFVISLFQDRWRFQKR